MGDNNGEMMWSCCNDEQTLFLLLYLAFGTLAFIFLRSDVAKPLRLAATFIHEMCHAVACWCTGGDVKAIQVYHNEGGVTQYSGGVRCIIIPAGYVGCSVAASIFVILSGGRRTATTAASLFTLALLTALCYSPNRTMVYLNLGYAVFMVTFIAIEWFVYTPILQFVILFFGVFLGIAAISDIQNDTILRSVQGSDSSACYQEVCPCCPPRCIGIQWILVAIFFQLFGCWCALVQMSNECEDLGWLQCFHLTTDWNFGDIFDIEEFRDKFDGFWHND